MAAPRTSGYAKSTDPSKPRTSAAVPFREIIPAPDHPKTAGIQDSDAHSWCQSRRKIDAPAWLINRLEGKNLERPYKGFTTDGTVRTGLYHYAEDEGAPIEKMVEAAAELIGLLSREQRSSTVFESVDVDEFRLWSNPELYVNPGGLRLDETTPSIKTAIHAILAASFSPAGYAKVLGCCLTNHFLGHLVHGPRVLNEHSYNFRLFGEPDLLKPWGYTFFGHHLCLAVVIKGRQMVIGPTFMGAEPDRIDEGRYAGLRLFKTEELLGLEIMQGLEPELQERATLSKGMDGDSLPPGRWNPFDERHLGGARQDNRVVPFEGCPVSLFSEAQREQTITLFKAFNEYYPEEVLRHRVENFKAHLDETYFAWIGEFGHDDPFYYRIHNPVAFLEFDFHCGIFLTNTSPARCHIHTINRLPNRGDYGRALLEGI
ncbi:hypothetical protein K432DRAFT_385369 [Lepidopterella palustris CBS 459.81]|uniref:Uncharacterized protein n=1 Tax=Lepidopterella palustris CBS 459.81 TaxID=1314670 RepID=A0A8E2E3J1_9PEZI|nr:hypothetical protein K432DRAFT_385369 [Lepidopterella palustris CBS 459.81]